MVESNRDQLLKTVAEEEKSEGSSRASMKET